MVDVTVLLREFKETHTYPEFTTNIIRLDRFWN